MVVGVAIICGWPPHVCQGAFSLLVNFIGFSRNQLRSGLSFGSVDSDGQDVIDFVFWIGLDWQISFGRSGFGRLDLMLCIVPTRIVRGFRSRLATVNREVSSLEVRSGQA